MVFGADIWGFRVHQKKWGKNTNGGTVFVGHSIQWLVLGSKWGLMGSQIQIILKIVVKGKFSNMKFSLAPLNHIKPHYLKPHFDFFGVKWGLVGLIPPFF